MREAAEKAHWPPDVLASRMTVPQVWVLFMGGDGEGTPMDAGSAAGFVAGLKNMDEERRLKMNQARAAKGLPPIPPRRPKP